MMNPSHRDSTDSQPPSGPADSPAPALSPAPPKKGLRKAHVFMALVIGLAIAGGWWWLHVEQERADREVREHLERIAKPLPRIDYTQPGDEEWWTYVNEQFPAGAPAFTIEQAQAWCDELMPLVEEITGRKFHSRPVIRLATRRELSASINRDFAAQRPELTSFGEAALQQMLGGQGLSVAVLGKYGMVDHVLYLSPENLTPLLEWAEIPQAMHTAMAKLVVAHELTHALQDQHLTLLEMMRRAAGPERSMAASAAVEGHAMVVEELVGARLGLDERTLEMARQLSAGEFAVDEDDDFEIAYAMSPLDFEFIYGRGGEFMRHHFGSGGMDKVWTILESPPESTAEIAQPDTYGRRAPGRMYRSLVADMGVRFGDKAWSLQNVEVGPAYIRSLLGSDNQKLIDDVLASTDHIQALLVQDASVPTRRGCVAAYLLKPGQDAKRMQRVLEEAARENLEAAAQAWGWTLDDFETSDVDGGQIGAGRLLRYRTTPPDAVAIDVRVYRFARDRVLVEITDMDMGVAQSTIIEAAGDVLERCEALLGSIPTRPPE